MNSTDDMCSVAGVELEVRRLGAGSPVLFLHPEFYFSLHEKFLVALARDRELIVPVHPGFDGRAPAGHLRRPGDLALLYLDLLDDLEFDDVALVGASFGGWIGLEMAVMAPERFTTLGLIAPLGVKLGGRESRDFADLFALPHEDADACLFAGAPPDLSRFGEAALTRHALERQYLAYYGWKPYLHRLGLEQWLHRVRMPVLLVWGERDGFVTPAYGRGLRERFPDAQLETVAGTAHYPQLERTEATAELVGSWLAKRVRRRGMAGGKGR